MGLILVPLFCRERISFGVCKSLEKNGISFWFCVSGRVSSDVPLHHMRILPINHDFFLCQQVHWFMNVLLHMIWMARLVQVHFVDHHLARAVRFWNLFLWSLWWLVSLAWDFSKYCMIIVVLFTEKVVLFQKKRCNYKLELKLSIIW